jgi:predicted dehydrogenase
VTASVERLRVGIIGPGRISDLHAKEYVASAHTEIAAVCKPDTDGALARARSWGANPEKVYADWQDILADGSIDAFEVLLPHHMHLEVALAALETGKHLSIQKPVGFTMAECQRFVEAADAATARGQVVRVFENFLFYPPVSRLVDIVRSGEIGDVLSVRQKSLSGDPACGWEVPPAAAEWRFDLERNGGGPLVFDDGLHKFSIFWSLLGVADEIHAWIGSTPVEGGALDSPSVVSLRWANGAVGALEVVNARELQVQTLFYSQDDRVEVTGTKGVGWVNRGHGKIQELPALQVYRDGRTTDYEDLESEWDVSFVLATRDFIAAVREGRGTLLSAAQHREVLSTALAAQISAREDRVVRPAEVG